jgi:hypothetical protein
MRPSPQAPPPPSRSRLSFMRTPIHIMSTPTPVFSTPSFCTNFPCSAPDPHPIFHGRLRIIQVDGDGNCLFRALLRAAGQIDVNHLELRRNCVDVIVQNWEDYTHQVNAIHHTAPAFATLINEHFPTKESYATYMSCPDHWGFEIEAVVCAEILQQPLLIWATADGSQLHRLIDYTPTARLFTQCIIHISYSELHYNALIHESDQTSLLLSQQVFNSMNTSRHVATPTDNPHPTRPSNGSHSEHLASPSARRQYLPAGRPAIAHASNSSRAHDQMLVPNVMSHRAPSRNAPQRQRPPSVQP